MDHNFADVGDHPHDQAKAQHMTNEELSRAQRERRLYLQTFQGVKQVEAIRFNGDGRYSTATVWTESDDPMGSSREYKAERADLLVQMKNSDRLQ